MAFSAQPQLNSSKVDFVPFTQKPTISFSGTLSEAPLGTSVTTKNFLYDRDDQDQLVLRTRPGLQRTADFSVPFAGIPTQSQEFQGELYYTIRGFVYKHTGSTNILLYTSADPFTDLQFCFYTNIANQTFLFVTQLGQLPRIINLTSLVVTTQTGTAASTLFINPVSIDNYVFCSRGGTKDIYQCDFDNPVNWTTGNFISADLTAGNILFLGRLANRIVIFKERGIEFMYNAGNPSGSVLAQDESFFRSLGIRHTSPQSLVKYNEGFYFIGIDSENKESVYYVTNSELGLVYNQFWSQSISNILNVSTINIFMFECLGKPYLYLNYKGRIYTLDIKEKIIVTFHTSVSEPMIVNHTFVWKDLWYLFASSFSGNANTPLQFSRIGLLSTTQYQDQGGVNITYEVQTGLVDHGTAYLKTCSRCLLHLVPTQPLYPTVTLDWFLNTTISAYSTPRTFALWNAPSGNDQRSNLSLNRLGRYRNRYYRFRFTGASFQLRGAAFDVSIGTN